MSGGQREEAAEYRKVYVLDGLEFLKARYHTHSFSKHIHEGYTIGVIEEGAQRFFRTGNNHVAGPGSIILVNADEVHNGHAATANGWSYRAIYPRPGQFQHLCADLFDRRQGVPYFLEAVVEDPFLAERLRLCLPSSMAKPACC